MIWKKTHKAAQLISHIILSRFNLRQLRKENGELFLIYKIIKDTQLGKWNNYEKQALVKIAKLREFYSNNHEEVTIKDFGAGNPDDERSDDEMCHGVESVESVSSIYRAASSIAEQGEFMFRLIRAFNPKTCFELGTCLGISAAYGTEALRLNSQGGNYITLEGAPALAQLTEKTMRQFSFKHLTVIEGRFEDTLPQLFNRYKNIDFAFIDGHHDEKATITYFNQFYDQLAEKSLLIFDDINWSKGMKRAWKTIQKDKRITWSVDNFYRGICYIDKTANTPQKHYKIWF